MEYDEEGRLIRIRRDYGGGNVQLAYEYGYGFDGGRRWRKDYLDGVWTRYPCGVACGAGELVEQTRPLSGGGRTTSALYLQGISLVRRNGEWHHFDPLGTAGVITGSNAAVLSNNLYDVFGVLRYQQGSAQTPWRWVTTRWEEEQMIRPLAARACSIADEPAYPARGITVSGQPVKPPDPGKVAKCLRKCWKPGVDAKKFTTCMASCVGKAWVKANCAWLVCMVVPDFCRPWGGDPCWYKDVRGDACQDCCEVNYYCCLATERPVVGIIKCYIDSVQCHACCNLMVDRGKTHGRRSLLCVLDLS